MDKLIEIYKNIKQWFWTLPLWKRLILTSLASALGGSSIVGFFNKYALYYHAYCQGFRVPIEGVSYISLFISLISFLFILISILGTIIVYNLLKLVTLFFRRKKVMSAKKSVNVRIAFVLFLVFLILIIIQNLFDIHGGVRVVLVGLTAIFFAYFITYIDKLFLRPNRKVITTILIILFLFSTVVSLFNQKVYTFFLKSIKYGGNIPIGIEYRKADNTEEYNIGSLLLMTNESLIFRNSTTNNKEEIPIDRISKISYLTED